MGKLTRRRARQRTRPAQLQPAFATGDNVRVRGWAKHHANCEGYIASPINDNGDGCCDVVLWHEYLLPETVRMQLRDLCNLDRDNDTVSHVAPRHDMSNGYDRAVLDSSTVGYRIDLKSFVCG